MANEQSLPHGRVLHSWKEIASYTGRGVRTIQRYESQLGFPVRRPSGSPRSAVLAFANEIDAWLAKSPTKNGSEVKVEVKEQKAVQHPHTIGIDTLHQKVRIGQERAEVMQQRIAKMQTLVTEINVRVRRSMERRKVGAAASEIAKDSLLRNGRAVSQAQSA
jgi:predicted DNA-binding transcriptional regulator AlpA